MKKQLIFLLMFLLIVNLIYYGPFLFACQHKEVEMLGRMGWVYCKKCNLRVFYINGEWRIAEDNPFKKWWYK